MLELPWRHEAQLLARIGLNRCAQLVRMGSPLLFQCNVCGSRVSARMDELERERPTCEECGSTVRFRAVVDSLSRGLWGRGLPLPDWPVRKDIRGVGLSDWPGYAATLAEKFDYQNTFYEKEPRLDITSLPDERSGPCDFLVATDVFEHVAPPVSMAFQNARRLLKVGGLLVLTVPYWLDRAHEAEHFPELNEWSVAEGISGRPTLTNRTLDGRTQTYSELVFHGGNGLTLEMRVFSLRWVFEELGRAGFRSVHVEARSHFEYGIHWMQPYSLPITARA